VPGRDYGGADRAGGRIPGEPAMKLLNLLSLLISVDLFPVADKMSERMM
jgi:hypothetical protein